MDDDERQVSSANNPVALIKTRWESTRGKAKVCKAHFPNLPVNATILSRGAMVCLSNHNFEPACLSGDCFQQQHSAQEKLRKLCSTMETTQMLATNLATLQSSFHSTVAQHGMPRNQR